MKRKFLILYLTLVFLYILLAHPKSENLKEEEFLDISSFANINEIQQDTINLNFNIDFDKKK